MTDLLTNRDRTVNATPEPEWQAVAKAQAGRGWQQVDVNVTCVCKGSIVWLQAMFVSFGMAEAYGGQCILRFDDTNPEAEKKEYIDHIQEIVAWMGWTPAQVHPSSATLKQFVLSSRILTGSCTLHRPVMSLHWCLVDSARCSLQVIEAAQYYCEQLLIVVNLPLQVRP